MEGRKRMRKTTYLLFLAIPVLLVSLLLLLPLVVSILPTFTRPKLGLGQYVAFFKDSFNRTIFFLSFAPHLADHHRHLRGGGAAHQLLAFLAEGA